MEVRLEELFGCWREAERADRAAEGLLRLRTALDLEFYDQISAVLREAGFFETSTICFRYTGLESPSFSTT
jgi:hypothetical protein